MDWQDFLGCRIFSDDAALDSESRAAAPPPTGTLLSICFESGYCVHDMDCSVNRAIADVAMQRLETVLVRHIMEKPFLQVLMADSIARGAEIRGYVWHGFLYFDFRGVALPICVASSVLKGLMDSLRRETVQVRTSLEGDCHIALFSVASFSLY